MTVYYELSKYCTVHSTIGTFGTRNNVRGNLRHWYTHTVGLAQKSRALLYSDLVRQPSTVTRQSMIETLQFHYSYFLGRHASAVH